MEMFMKLCRPSVNYLQYLLIRKCTSVSKDKSTVPLTNTVGNDNSVPGGTSISKDNRIFEAIGATDELSSYLGFAREFAISNHHPYSDTLTRIQTMLVDIIFAISKSNEAQEKRGVTFPARNTQELEEWITEYSQNLSPAENYLLPGGGKASTSLHIARCICRRAERSVLPLVKDGILDNEVQVYFDRLADLLFTLARYAAKKDERSESVYTPTVSKTKEEKPSSDK